MAGYGVAYRARPRRAAGTSPSRPEGVEKVLFNSATFLFLFLPVAWAGYAWVRRRSMTAAILWLLAASLAFYGIDQPRFLPLLVISITANFALARLIAGSRRPTLRLMLLLAGLAGNLGALFYFKYSAFFFNVAADVLAVSDRIEVPLLPVGISFYTFLQVAFLTDSYRGQQGAEPSFLRYGLFVTFFPHLIAGPIVHHSEMMPALQRGKWSTTDDFLSGLTLLIIGLFKKVAVADAFAIPASRIFGHVAAGAEPSFIEGWVAALSYTLQIYYDFSAYSDMAVGLARMFGIPFPINFASPYKARSIVDFWRRWHITLSRFLRDYLYFSLGGSRKGAVRHKVNLLLTMVLGGLWHGAGWTFLVWGALHGAFLLVNHAWAEWKGSAPLRARRWWPALSWGLTFLCVVFAWVPFRADSLQTALRLWEAMAGLNGIVVPDSLAGQLARLPIDPALLGLRTGTLDIVRTEIAMIAVALWLTLVLPNAYQIMADYRMGLPTKGYPASFVAPSRLRWRPALGWAILCGAALAVTVLKINDPSEFIYFQF